MSTFPHALSFQDFLLHFRNPFYYCNPKVSLNYLTLSTAGLKKPYIWRDWPPKKETWSNCSQVLQYLEVQYLQVLFATRLGWVSSRIWKRTQQLSLFIKCSNHHLGLPLPSLSGSPVARCSFHQTEPLGPISCDTSGCLIYSFLHISSCDCLHGC